MPDVLQFDAVALPTMRMEQHEQTGVFILQDSEGRQLHLRMPVELGAALVASTQSLFISILSRAAVPTNEGRERWRQRAVREPSNASVYEAPRGAKEVHLSLDENTRYELHYKFPPDGAEQIGKNLQQAARACRGT